MEDGGVTRVPPRPALWSLVSILGNLISLSYMYLTFSCLSCLHVVLDLLENSGKYRILIPQRQHINRRPHDKLKTHMTIWITLNIYSHGD